MTPETETFLRQMAIQDGTWPATPFVQSAEGQELMRLGLAELIQPESPYLPYAELTAAGARAAQRDDDRMFDCPSCGKPFHADEDVLAAHCPHCGAYGLLLRGEDHADE